MKAKFYLFAVIFLLTSLNSVCQENEKSFSEEKISIQKLELYACNSVVSDFGNSIIYKRD